MQILLLLFVLLFNEYLCRILPRFANPTILLKSLQAAKYLGLQAFETFCKDVVNFPLILTKNN